jgi:hypothetical protein
MTEEELFGNTIHTNQFEEFMDILGQRVRLQGLDGYSGYSCYTEFLRKCNSKVKIMSTPFQKQSPSYVSYFFLLKT